MLAQFVEQAVRQRPLTEAGELLGPGQGGALARGEVGGFLPDAERLQTLLGLAGLARVVGMHVHAVGATVDLRSAQVDQFDQRAFQAGLGQGLFQAEHGGIGVGGGFGPFEAGGHGESPWLIGSREGGKRRGMG